MGIWLDSVTLPGMVALRRNMFRKRPKKTAIFSYKAFSRLQRKGLDSVTFSGMRPLSGNILETTEK